MLNAVSLRLEDVTFGHLHLKPVATHDATRSAIYLVLRGSCAVTTAAETTLRLSVGELGFIPGGSPHCLTASASPGSPDGSAAAELIWFRFRVAGEHSTLAPLAAMHLPSATSRAAAWLWRLAPLLASTPTDRPSATACCHLAKAVLHQALEDVAAGRSAILNPADTDVARVVDLMHAQPERKWTIDMLAHEVGISRSSLADRFTHALRQPPMEYLHHLRMQRAALLLEQPEYEIKRIATAVGYRSIAAFSHAFRRWNGNSPSSYRRRMLIASFAAS